MDKNKYYDKRLDRLEEKVDVIQENQIEMKADLRVFTDEVRNHVSADQRIAAQIEPLVSLVPQLASMVEDHKVKRANRLNRVRRAKTMALYLGIIGGVVSIAVGLSKLGII